jgi:hypothetical protein
MSMPVDPREGVLRALAREFVHDAVLELAELVLMARNATPPEPTPPPSPRRTEGQALQAGTQSDAARFWAKVRKGGEDECWLWQGGMMKSGYGVFSLDGKRVRAHRYAYVISAGALERGLEVLHSCDVRACQNPRHLRAGTHQENMNDAVLRRRHRYGEGNARARLKADDVRAIRRSTESAVRLAARYGVNPGTIHSIRRWKTWKYLQDPISGTERVTPNRDPPTNAKGVHAEA